MRRRAQSIGLRLTLWGAATTLLVGFLVCVVLYLGVRYSLYDEVDTFLEGEIHEFVGELKQHDSNLSNAEQAIRSHLNSRSRIDLRFRILDQNDSIVLTSDPNDPVPVRHNRALENQTDSAVFETIYLRGEEFPLRLCSMSVRDANGRIQIAQASYTLDQLVASLAVLRKVAAVSLIFAALLAIVAGKILAARSLAPLHRMTSIAEQISTSRLSERLPRSSNGDEFDRLAAILNNLLDRVEKYVGRMQQFTADAAHELRSPLAALRGRAEVTLTRERTQQELKNVLEENVEHYDHLIRITEDLLLLARLDAGEIVFHKEKIQLNDAVADVVDLFSPVAAERGLTLQCRMESQVPIIGDPSRLRQLVANLLDNAIKYASSPGSIDILLTRQNGYAHMQVKDTGMGISPEDLPKIFDRFFRADQSRSKNGSGGAGLGLAICDSIVRGHDGTITMTSAPAKGTTVTVQLPIAKSA